MALRPQILVALGLSACADPELVTADLDRQARGGDTCETGDTGPQICLAPLVDTGPCLSAQVCLCTCDTSADAGAWLIGGVGLIAVARRRRSEIAASFEDELPADVKARLQARE